MVLRLSWNGCTGTDHCVAIQVHASRCLPRGICSWSTWQQRTVRCGHDSHLSQVTTAALLIMYRAWRIIRESFAGPVPRPQAHSNGTFASIGESAACKRRDDTDERKCRMSGLWERRERTELAWQVASTLKIASKELSAKGILWKSPWITSVTSDMPACKSDVGHMLQIARRSWVVSRKARVWFKRWLSTAEFETREIPTRPRNRYVSH